MDITSLGPAPALVAAELSVCSPVGTGGGKDHGLGLLLAPEHVSARGFFPAFPAALGNTTILAPMLCPISTLSR